MAEGKCPRCNTAYGKSARFCKGCGAFLGNADSSPPPEPEPIPLTDKAFDELWDSDSAPGASRSDSSPADHPTSDAATSEDIPSDAPASPARYLVEITRHGAGTAESKDERIELVPGKALQVGAASESELCLADDPYVSRRHAALEVRDGVVYVRDLGSSNGTFVQITGERAVQDGDWVVLGTTRLRIRREG